MSDNVYPDYRGGSIVNLMSSILAANGAECEIYQLLKHEGICLGGSSAINMAGAVKMARELGPGHTIVTILCDYGDRYQSKIYNPTFLRRRGLPTPDWNI